MTAKKRLTLFQMFRAHSVSLAEAARICDVTKTAVHYWVRGRTCPPDKAIQLLAETLGESTYDVFLAWVRAKLQETGWGKERSVKK